MDLAYMGPETVCVVDISDVGVVPTTLAVALAFELVSMLYIGSPGFFTWLLLLHARDAKQFSRQRINKTISPRRKRKTLISTSLRIALCPNKYSSQKRFCDED